MIAALIAWGIGFGGVNYLPTHGLSAIVVPIPCRADVVFQIIASATLAEEPELGAVVTLEPGITATVTKEEC